MNASKWSFKAIWRSNLPSSLLFPSKLHKLKIKTAWNLRHLFSQDVSALLLSIHATPAPAVAEAAATEAVTEVTEVVRGRRMAAPCAPGAFEVQRSGRNCRDGNWKMELENDPFSQSWAEF